MEKLIVNASGMAYADNGAAGTVTIDTITSLSHGAIAIFTEDGTLFDASTATAPAELNVYQGNSYAKPVLIGTLYPREFKYATSAYAAAAAKVMHMGTHSTNGTTYNLNMPSTLVEGTTGGINIVNLSKPHEDTRRYHNYEEVVRSGDTITTFMTRLLARITADTNKCIASVLAIASSSVTNGVRFTGKSLVDFTVYGTGILENADVIEYNNIVLAKSAGLTKGYLSLTTNMTAFSNGKNTLAMLQQLERDTNVYLGDNGKDTERGNELFKLPSRLESINYKTFTLACKTPPNMGGLVEPNNFENTFTFAIKSDDTVVSAVIANVNTLWG